MVVLVTDKRTGGTGWSRLNPAQQQRQQQRQLQLGVHRLLLCCVSSCIIIVTVAQATRTGGGGGDGGDGGGSSSSGGGSSSSGGGSGGGGDACPARTTDKVTGQSCEKRWRWACVLPPPPPHPPPPPPRFRKPPQVDPEPTPTELPKAWWHGLGVVILVASGVFLGLACALLACRRLCWRKPRVTEENGGLRRSEYALTPQHDGLPDTLATCT
ncbi:protein FAM117B-like [Lethenteron reissneri]|uniref:protein FAM117B-like n=1 Tax=Lethenteron reissneri TaxID=7753 RepID=UPI002AB75849|nr:protein FAM117B-like [Lethenteron reissneri]